MQQRTHGQTRDSQRPPALILLQMKMRTRDSESRYVELIIHMIYNSFQSSILGLICLRVCT